MRYCFQALRVATIRLCIEAQCVARSCSRRCVSFGLMLQCAPLDWRSVLNDRSTGGLCAGHAHLDTRADTRLATSPMPTPVEREELVSRSGTVDVRRLLKVLLILARSFVPSSCVGCFAVRHSPSALQPYSVDTSRVPHRRSSSRPTCDSSRV